MSNKYLDSNGLSHFWDKLKEYFATKSHIHGSITNDGKLSAANRIVISNGDKSITTSDVTTSELNVLDGITATTAELNVLHGITATVSELNTLDGITANVTELNYCDGVTGSIQTQLNGKATSTHTHGNITNTGGLTTANRVVITDSNQNITTGTVTTTEIGYLSGASGNIQDQLNTISNNITSVMHYKGTVDTVAALDDSSVVSSKVIGDFWNVSSDGANYAWNGSNWDQVGFAVEFSSITNGEIDNIAV